MNDAKEAAPRSGAAGLDGGRGWGAMRPRATGGMAGRGQAVLALGTGLAALVANVAWKAARQEPVGAQYLHWGYTDIVPLFHVHRLEVGAVPYLDSAVEYPVLTGLQLWLAGQAATSGTSFLWWTAALLAIGLVATVWLLGREVGWRRALVVAAAPTLVVSAAVNWDLPSLALATGGLIAHRRGRDGWSGVWLGLGTAAKLWPGLALLAIVPAAWAMRGRRAGLATAGAAIGAWLAVNVPVMVVAFGGWARFLELNRARGVDWDPLWAVLRRTEVWHPSDGLVDVASALLFIAGAAVIVVGTARLVEPARWHHAVLPLVAWFLLVNKVWSPQFSLWLLPLLALTFPGWRWVLAFGVADVAVMLTRFRYLAGFVPDEATQAGAWPAAWFDTALVVRALILVAMVWVAWRHATSTPTSSGPALP